MRRAAYQLSGLSYWATVVASGDTVWASVLIGLYDADPNWPAGIEGTDCGLGATVLQIAIVSKNKDMVKLLLDEGADVNQPEDVWVDGSTVDSYSLQTLSRASIIVPESSYLARMKLSTTGGKANNASAKPGSILRRPLCQ